MKQQPNAEDSNDYVEEVAGSDGLRCTPGLVDLQVNGFNGVDFNDASIDAEKMQQALDGILSTGVTTCLPTLISGSKEQLQRRLQAVDRAVNNCKLGPLMVPGYHLEGPFLNPASGYAGCHPAQQMSTPSIALVGELERALSRPILYITVAPELENSLEFITWASGRHKIVGAGHTSVSAAQLSAAVACGLRVSTHLGNGLPKVLPKFENPLLAQLSEDKISATFIADGVHIPPAVLRTFIRAKGASGSILVTDAVSAANCRAGRYALAGMAIELRQDGSVRLPDSDYLAGSSLRMHDAVKNIVDWQIVDFRSAIRMASANPMTLLSPGLKAHAITPEAGELVWNADCTLESVCLAGYSRQAGRR